MPAGVEDLDADDPALGIEIHDEARAKLFALDDTRVSEADVEGIYARIVLRLHWSASACEYAPGRGEP